MQAKLALETNHFCIKLAKSIRCCSKPKIEKLGTKVDIGS